MSDRLVSFLKGAQGQERLIAWVSDEFTRAVLEYAADAVRPARPSPLTTDLGVAAGIALGEVLGGNAVLERLRNPAMALNATQHSSLPEPTYGAGGIEASSGAAKEE